MMRPLAPLLAAALAAGLLAGCASWPEPGAGGYAERRPATEPRLAALVDRYEALRDRGAPRFVAGLADEARLLMVRAQRNHAAGLDDDFSLDLTRLAALLDRIELHLRNRTP